jgi:hypothetical protein
MKNILIERKNTILLGTVDFFKKGRQIKGLLPRVL